MYTDKEAWGVRERKSEIDVCAQRNLIYCKCVCTTMPDIDACAQGSLI